MVTVKYGGKIMKKIGIYVHIPFCIKKCNYCNFNSLDQYTSRQQMDYTLALLKEMVLYGKELEGKYEVDSIYIGGGTPSCIPESAMVAIISGLYSNFVITDDCEISIEANPKTLTHTKASAYFKAGINRLSIGAQSFHRDELEALTRIHTPQEFYRAYEMARGIGFKNINIDLMFGIPNQTEEKWAATVGVATKLKPDHISFYSLELDKKTPLFWAIGKGEYEIPSESDDRVMYHYVIAALKKAGYNHYEISNCAKEGKECRHNLKYWSMEPYLGLGLGASSYFEGKRSQNLDDINEYIKAVDDNNIPFKTVHKNTIEDSMKEFVFTGLRKTEGINLKLFEDVYGLKFMDVYGDKKEYLERSQEEGILYLDENRLTITEKGIDISNKIMAEFV